MDYRYMDIETYSSSNMFNYVDDSYSLLYDSFIEFLKDKKDLARANYSDYLTILLDKIKYGVNLIEADPQLVGELNKLKKVIQDILIEEINKDYFGDTDLLYKDNNLVNIIYYKFYYNKPDTVIDFLFNTIIRNKSIYITRYKESIKERKDLKVPYKQLNLNVLLVKYYDIINCIIESDGSFLDVIDTITLSYDERLLLEQYVEFSDYKAMYKSFICGVKENIDFYISKIYNKLVLYVNNNIGLKNV